MPVADAPAPPLQPLCCSKVCPLAWSPYIPAAWSATGSAEALLVKTRSKGFLDELFNSDRLYPQ